MTNEQLIDEMIEEVMRCYGNFDDYDSEKLREKYRQLLTNTESEDKE